MLKKCLLPYLLHGATSQEIPRIYGTRKFITVLTSARHTKEVQTLKRKEQIYCSV
jgi:hypothetical protein